MSKPDIEIAREATKLPISTVAERLGLGADDLVPYGHDKAKIRLSRVAELQQGPRGKLVLVTAMSPTPRRRPPS